MGEQGGHSKSVAVLNLGTPLSSSLEKFEAVTGASTDNQAVYGKLYDSYPAGTSTIEVQYLTADVQKDYVRCQVGGLSRPNLDGCYTAEGTVSINGQAYPYTYDPRTQNVNKRTIMKMSTTAEEKMFRCENCPFATYAKFREYYGFFDYADKWIQAAFDGTGTKVFARGNASFNRYGFKGKAEAIKKATAYMSIWMYVIREMEDALSDCKDNCKKTGCNDDTVRAWDEAVAYYTGSLEGIDGQGSGKLLYALADKRCANFRTCGDLAKETEGTSHVNRQIIRFLTLGSRMLTQAKCTEAREYKEKVEAMMTVPLIQGTLRYAHITSTQPSSGEKAEAERAVFAASILPIVAACDDDAADVIFKNMKTGQNNSANFIEVKRAFESIYDCIGIRGQDVGGVWDPATGDYAPGARPYQESLLSQSSGTVNLPLIIGCTAGGVVAGIIAYIFVSKCCCSNSQVPTGTKEDPMAEDAEANPSNDDVLPSMDSQSEPIEIS